MVIRDGGFEKNVLPRQGNRRHSAALIRRCRAGSRSAKWVALGGESVSSLKLTATGTSLEGESVAQILAKAEGPLGGGMIPTGYSISSLSSLIDLLVLITAHQARGRRLT